MWCSHSLQATSKGLHTNYVQMCLRVLCERALNTAHCKVCVSKYDTLQSKAALVYKTTHNGKHHTDSSTGETPILRPRDCSSGAAQQLMLVSSSLPSQAPPPHPTTTALPASFVQDRGYHLCLLSWMKASPPNHTGDLMRGNAKNGYLLHYLHSAAPPN